MKKKTYNRLIEFDKRCNVFFAGILNFLFKPVVKFGNPDQTISTVFGINRKVSWQCAVAVWVLRKIDNRHCELAYKNDQLRQQKKRSGN